MKRKHLINREISAGSVYLINNTGEKEKHTIKSAIQLAIDSKLDLVQFSKDDIPICKLMDYSKFMYDQSKKDKISKKKQKESHVKLKEIKFRPSTGDGDLKVKAASATKMLLDGCKIKLTIAFKGRELSHRDVGMKTLEKFMSYAPEFELDDKPSFSGKYLIVTGHKRK